MPQARDPSHRGPGRDARASHPGDGANRWVVAGLTGTRPATPAACSGRAHGAGRQEPRGPAHVPHASCSKPSAADESNRTNPLPHGPVAQKQPSKDRSSPCFPRHGRHRLRSNPASSPLPHHTCDEPEFPQLRCCRSLLPLDRDPGWWGGRAAEGPCSPRRPPAFRDPAASHLGRPAGASLKGIGAPPFSEPGVDNAAAVLAWSGGSAPVTPSAQPARDGVRAQAPFFRTGWRAQARAAAGRWR